MGIPALSNATPGSPVAGGKFGGRKTNNLIILVCHGYTEGNAEVEEAADCLGADCVPCYVEMKQMENLDVETIFQQSKVAMDIKEDAGNMFPRDGTLTSSDFFRAAHMFSDKWRRFNTSVPPWLWVPCLKRRLSSSHEVEGYLSLEKLFLLKSSEEKGRRKSDIKRRKQCVGE